MTQQWELLVVSSRLENKKALLRILKDLPASVITASTIEQAGEVLATHSIRLVFAEEHFIDGSYRELLTVIRFANLNTRLVLMLCTGEWPEYLEALRLGAADVIRCPLQATDVELSLIRAAREYEAQVPREVTQQLPPEPAQSSRTEPEMPLHFTAHAH